MQNTPASRPRLIYVFDPLCGWCFGFSPVIKKLYEHYHQVYDFEVITGGLVLGDRVGTIDTNFPFVKDSLPRLEEIAGVKIGQPFYDNILDNSATFIFNSEPPCVAYNALTGIRPEIAVPLAHDLQQAMYVEGKSFNDTSTFIYLANKHGIDTETFLNAFIDPMSKGITSEKFRKAYELGATGYPSLLIEKDGIRHFLTRGYASYDEIVHSLGNLE